ncbi:hypothetical protein [Myxococcus sp. Y35]
MDARLQKTLETWCFKPSTLRGKPVSVKCVLEGDLKPRATLTL